MQKHAVAAFYCFTPLSESEISTVKSRLEAYAVEDQISGLIILGPEGLNTTLASPTRAGLERFIAECETLLKVERIQAKWSEAPKKPFRRFKIKVREEIVTLSNPDVLPEASRESYLSPDEWDQMLKDPDVICIDTRNDYEIRLGKFKGALDPAIDKFSDFPKVMEKMALPPDKKILLYCTGGIRCEKATTDLKLKGYKNVFQLDGGILRYLQERPDQSFEGECFVFDHRVAVDQKLEASKRFDLCPCCGDPAGQWQACIECGEKAQICDPCIALFETEPDRQTCSKNCRYHARRKRGLVTQPRRPRTRRETSGA